MSQFMNAVFFLAAIALAISSSAFVSQATFGVWMMAGACLCGILARLFQAESQHQANMKART